MPRLILALPMLALALGLPVAAHAASPSVAVSASLVSIPVLKSGVQKGETISAENLMQKEFPASQVFASTLTVPGQIIGQQAQRPLSAGTPLNKLHLKVVPVVARNQPVTLHYTKGAVELTVQGQALEDGNLGQPIKVLNPATRATIVGTVSGPGTVDIH